MQKKSIEKLLLDLIAEKVDNVIIFLSPGLDELLIPFLKTHNFSLSNIFLAVSDPDQLEPLSSILPADQVLTSTSIDFIDRVKIITNGKGFPEVVILSRSPLAVKQALGVAGVFGTVHLFFAPDDIVKTDLHNTINYKSLKVKGYTLTQ